MKNFSQIKRSPYFRTAMMIMVALLALTMGIRIVVRLADQSQKREMHQWEMLLNRDAENRTIAVNRWLETQFSELEALSNNTSLRLYLSEMMASKSRNLARNNDSYQMVYLRNLITLTARRAGFAPQNDSSIRANVDEGNAAAGLVLLARNREPIVQTANMPTLENSLGQFVERVAVGSKAISDIYTNSDGQAAIAFAVPIFAIQSDPTPENQIGMIVGTKPVEASLFTLLNEPVATEKTLETLLVSFNPESNTLFYLSPLADGTPPISKMIDASNTNIASVFAASHPGQFAIKHDYRFDKVLVTGRKIEIAPWYLVHKINRDEALASSDSHAQLIYLVGFTILAFLTAFFLAVWHYGLSIRANNTAERYKKLAEEVEAQKNLLSLLADHKPEALYIVDEEGNCHFSNIEAARQAGLASPKETYGKTLVSLIGKDRNLTYTQLNASALLEKRVTSNVERLQMENGEMIIQSRHIPLSNIPGTSMRGILILEQDITGPMLEKERFANILNSLVETLINVVDTRDEFTANHSTRVSQLARAVAAEMELDYASLDTVETAGLLMNIGKIFVPLTTLTKTGKLTPKENQIIDKALEQGAELLKTIHFDGPVADSILQAHALRRKKEVKDTLLTARIIHIANMFVSMLSPRAYRDRMTIDGAMDILNDTSGHEKDRAIIAALLNYLENHGGRELWEAKTAAKKTTKKKASTAAKTRKKPAKKPARKKTTKKS